MPDRQPADPLQTIAELRRQLDERTAERDEALAREAAAAEVLRVVNSSPGDLAPVFDAMLEKATHLCDAAFGILRTWDGERFHQVAFRGVPPALEDYFREPLTPTPGTAAARLVQGEALICISDLSEDPAYRAGAPGLRALVELGNARSYTAVALQKDGALLGNMTIYRQEVRPFTNTQIALLQNFAAQAVIAMENARLITETREALEQQTATAEVLGVINSSPGDLAPVFDAMLDKALRLCEASFGWLRTYDNDAFQLAAIKGVPAPYAEFLALNAFGMPPSQARVLAGERLIHIPDLSNTEEYRVGEPNRRAIVDLGGARTLLLAPLLKDETLRGYFSIYRQEARPFSDRQIALLQNFAAQAVIAMENARLITETREALEQQTATAEVLQVINSSPGDLAPVFDAMLEKAMRLCDGDQSALWMFGGERATLAASKGISAEFVEALHERPPQPLQQILRGDPLVEIADLAEHELYKKGDQTAKAAVELGWVRAVVFVALLRDVAPVGAFVIARREARRFTDKQVALLQNFAAQAVIAMENARLITETREALEQQTATAEVLQVINSSPGDLAPVFDAMLEKATELCDAAFGNLWTYDGERFHSVAHRGASQALADFLRDPQTPGAGTTLGEFQRGATLVHLADVANGPAYLSGDSFSTAFVELGGARTVLGVPLLKDEVLLGGITAFRREVRPFTDKQIALLQNFAAQAVIAMENARLITETREALDQQTATAEVLQVINASPGDLTPVFDAMLDKAHRLCGAALGALVAYDGEHFRALTTHGYPEEYAAVLRQPFPPSKFHQALLDGAGFIHIADTASIEWGPGTEIFRGAVETLGARTVLFVPLRKDGTLLGLISAVRLEVRSYSDKEIALLQNFAAQAVIAMENARLIGELRARTDEIAGWNKELEARVAAQLAEIERTGKLRRFLAPQLAELIIAQGDESILESHRREIVVVFCDLRGFTGFAERAEPEEVMALLADYHAAMGPIVASFEGTLDHYAGDGIMVFFNDPVPTPDPARRAIDMAVAMRAAAQDLLRSWRRRGHDIGFGVGISQGYATLGQIGFAERMDYTAIGTVTNLAARLCAEAKDGQILVSRRVAIAVEDSATLEEIGDLSLKGLSQAVLVYNVPQ